MNTLLSVLTPESEYLKWIRLYWSVMLWIQL
jgi:hypothetical protein